MKKTGKNGTQIHIHLYAYIISKIIISVKMFRKTNFFCLNFYFTLLSLYYFNTHTSNTCIKYRAEHSLSQLPISPASAFRNETSSFKNCNKPYTQHQQCWISFCFLLLISLSLSFFVVPCCVLVQMHENIWLFFLVSLFFFSFCTCVRQFEYV